MTQDPRGWGTHTFFYCCSITVVCIFSPPLHPTTAKLSLFPCLHPPPWFCPCVLYSSSCKPLSPRSPPHSPLAIVRLFLTSMSLVVFCSLFSFVDFMLSEISQGVRDKYHMISHIFYVMSGKLAVPNYAEGVIP